MTEEIRDLVRDWEQRHQGDFAKERKPENEFTTESGIPVKRVYTPLDLEEKGFDYQRDLGMPGEFPYTRSDSPCKYRRQPWDHSMYSGYGLPEDSNKLWREAVQTGVETIYIAYDLPTQLGLDPDSRLAHGEVGRMGVSMVTQRDWEVALDGINLNQINLSHVPNAVVAFETANLILLAQKTGADLSNITGHCHNDILKEYTVRGNYIFPVEPSIRLTIDVVSYCRKLLPKYLTLSVTGLHFSEAQATNIHEAAFMMADLYCYLDAAIARGLDIDDIAPCIELSTQCDHYTFFEEIAKHRALRRLYARAMKERYGAKKPESLRAHIGASQGGHSLQKNQYLNNIGRTAIAAVAATLAGLDRLTLRTYDEQFGIPSTDALMTASRLKYVITKETDMLDTVDPLAGSYFVEWLTAEMEERINEEIATIEKQGGALKCVENGYFKRKLIEDAYLWQKDFEAGKKIRVGANFATTEDNPPPPFVYRARPSMEKERIAAVAEVKRKRDNSRVKRAMEELKALAGQPTSNETNLMPAMIEAADSYATVGEVTNALKEVWGEYTQTKIF